MKHDIFYLYGKLIYRGRWAIILLVMLALAISLPLVPKVMTVFNSTGFFAEKSESHEANELLNNKLGYSYNRFILLYHHPTWLATQDRFISEIKKSLSSLDQLSTPHEILYPDNNTTQISKDKHTAYAVVMFKSNQEVGHDVLMQFEDMIKTPPHLTLQMGGEPIFLDDVTKQTQVDLGKAEFIGTPAAILMLLIIFGSVIAALLPVMLGAICAIFMLAMLYWIGSLISLSVFTINIALLVGLCLSLDYALLIISRFRQQIIHEENAAQAIAITLSTAGKAVFFSGLIVLICLSALLFFPVNVLFSVGIGGLTAVFIAMITALLILPALLSILYKKINLFSFRLFKKTHTHYWKNGITTVVHQPVFFFCFILLILAALCYPIMYAKFGISNYRILPEHSSSRQFFNYFNAAFDENELSPILVLAKSKQGKITSSRNIGNLYDFAKKIKNNSTVDQITSIVTTDEDVTKKQYQTMYQLPRSDLPSSLQTLLKISTTKDFSVLTIVSQYADTSTKTKDLIYKIRSMKVPNMTLAVTGGPANTLDVLKGIGKVFPFALLWIMTFTYVILLISLRSMILPLKAIFTTALSLGASFGVLVFIIQFGHFHEFLHFEPQGMLDISLCIIIFCALFGFSMDYEVFLLARIKERYEKTGDTLNSIIYGIDHSSRIITSAAIIVILICFSFMSANILIVKAFGLGIAVAIFVDAFLIRILFVPAAMALLNHWNWYLPKWLQAILPKVYFHPPKIHLMPEQ